MDNNMKVVLFCGGLGTRLREHSETIPKPLVPVGYRPIVWHLMKYYAHYGHKEFILCLGYKGETIKDYFLNYRETDSPQSTRRRQYRARPPLRPVRVVSDERHRPGSLLQAVGDRCDLVVCFLSSDRGAFRRRDLPSGPPLAPRGCRARVCRRDGAFRAGASRWSGRHAGSRSSDWNYGSGIRHS